MVWDLLGTTLLYPIISLYPYYIPYYIPIKSHPIFQDQLHKTGILPFLSFWIRIFDSSFQLILCFRFWFEFLFLHPQSRWSPAILFSLFFFLMFSCYGYRSSCIWSDTYGVATISRLLKIIGLFCRIWFFL